MREAPIEISAHLNGQYQVCQFVFGEAFQGHRRGVLQQIGNDDQFLVAGVVRAVVADVAFDHGETVGTVFVSELVAHLQWERYGVISRE